MTLTTSVVTGNRSPQIVLGSSPRMWNQSPFVCLLVVRLSSILPPPRLTTAPLSGRVPGLLVYLPVIV
eukprot:16367782-Heterocapsa_arctica.AAC.1